MKKLLLLTTCLLGRLVAADTSALPSDPAPKNTPSLSAALPSMPSSGLAAAADDTQDIRLSTTESVEHDPFDQVIDTFKLTFATIPEISKELDWNAKQELIKIKQLALKKLLSTQIVMDRIMRPANQAMFDANGPTDCSAQEIWLYKQLAENRCWTYRGCIGNPAYVPGTWGDSGGGFYETGTCDGYELLKVSLSQISDAVAVMFADRDVYQIRKEMDEFDLRGFIHDTPRVSSSARVLVTPHGKDDHASMFVHVLDKNRTSILASIFINSSAGSGDYFMYIKERFNYGGHYNYTIAKPLDAEPLDADFPMLAIEEHDFLGFKRVCVDRRNVLIDASHHLQIADGDHNCSLYAHNFCKAVGDMVSDSSIAAEIFEATEAFAAKVVANENYSDQELTLSAIFKNHLKAFLPQYYNTDGTPRSPEQLKDYHMRMRWNVSAQRIFDFSGIEEDRADKKDRKER